jgi:hypothetical protein
MRTVVATLLLAGLMLNAGAFASDNRAYLHAKAKDANITVLRKNQTWPARRPLTLEPCTKAGCIGV